MRSRSRLDLGQRHGAELFPNRLQMCLGLAGRRLMPGLALIGQPFVSRGVECHRRILRSDIGSLSDVSGLARNPPCCFGFHVERLLDLVTTRVDMPCPPTLPDPVVSTRERIAPQLAVPRFGA